jgi:hypothetical protein
MSRNSSMSSSRAQGHASTSHRSLPISQMVERHPDDGWKLAEPIAMSKASERALDGVVQALLPPRPAPRTLELDRRVTQHVRRMLRYMLPPLALGFIVLVRLLELSPIWRLQAFKRLSSLEPAAASKILQGIATSRFMLLRLMMLGPKAVVLSTYFDQDECHQVLNYEPKGFLRERIQRREVLVAEERVLFASQPPPPPAPSATTTTTTTRKATAEVRP